MTGSRAETSEGRCEHGLTYPHDVDRIDGYNHPVIRCPGPVSSGVSEGHLTDEELAEIEARADAATAGPWRITFHSHLEAGCRCMSCCGPTTVYQTSNSLDCEDVPPITDGFGSDSGDRCDTTGYVYADADFIAHARTDVPRLLAAVRGQGEALRRVRELHQCDSFGNCTECCDYTEPVRHSEWPCRTLRALDGSVR